jgi:hypothetical protein
VSEKLILDSFALVSLFHKEPGAEKVRYEDMGDPFAHTLRRIGRNDRASSTRL